MPRRPVCLGIFFSIVIHLFILLATSFADTVAVMPSDIIEQALEMRLHEDPTWHALIHYEPRTLGGYVSRVDDEKFFLARDGKFHPKNELVKTLQAFFEEGDDDSHPLCRFPARLQWLKGALPLLQSEVEDLSCARFSEWINALSPNGITMVFPSAFLNNPASAFGHTLLRIDSRDQDEESRLLAYTASFAASTSGEDPVSYALRGTFGGYPGFFNVFPYYQTVKQYSDLEHRDIWEYQLNITPHEADFLTKHLWELKGIAYQYFYFDENCAFQMLALLNVLWPEKALLEKLKPWVIPIDVVREVVAQKSLVKQTIFRPALATTLQSRAATMSQVEIERAKSLVEREETLVLPADSPEILDLAYDYLSYALTKGKVSHQVGSKKGLSLLSARSKLNVPSSTFKVEATDSRPDQGHSTSRMRTGVGRRSGKSFYELQYRPAHHDLLDPSQGFLRGSQIEMFATSFRHTEDESFKLEEFKVLDLFSLSPRTDLFQPHSWRLSTGVRRKRFHAVRDGLITDTRFGYGFTWSVDEAMAYSLLNSSLQLGGKLDTNFAGGVGVLAGMLYQPIEAWAIKGEVEHLRLWGDTHTSLEYRIEQRLSLTSDLALRFALARRHEYTTYDNEMRLSLDLFF